MLFKCMLNALVNLGLLAVVASSVIGSKPAHIIKPYKRAPLQDIVTWDQHSVFVYGERIMIFSGEFHPFRLPVPALWLDIFQKLKSAGFSAVSFYVDWALLEGKEGTFTAEGVFGFEQFFDAATEAGIYLLARPGPYINAEASGGGFPGWLQRYKAVERTPSYVPLTQNYVSNIGKIIAKAQITNGGPVILLQPENEYTGAAANVLFPDADYFQSVEDQYRDAGIVVPFYSNDAWTRGLFTPGSGKGEVDIYGHDGYPLGFDCAKPTTWPDQALPTYYLSEHEIQSPSTPYTISEFQGGSFDPWGGQGFTKCAELLNEEFERVFYKNNYAVGVTIFNLYMVFGGTNWGNLGHPGGYTSYDYGSIIAEDRTISREKYSELKLEANFLKASPAYLTSNGGYTNNGSYVNTNAIATTRLSGNVTNFYIVRQAAYNSLAWTNYTLTIPTSLGNRTIPALSPTLTLNGRDSKIHSVDYDLGGIRMLYSSAEIFTWKKFGPKTVLVLYGAAGETHEAAFVGMTTYSITEGNGVASKVISGALVLNWAVTPTRKVVQIGPSLVVYLLDRNDAYNYWVMDLPGSKNYTTPSATSIIVRAGYLLRTASFKGTSTLYLTGDINATTTIEVIGGAEQATGLIYNGNQVLNFWRKTGVIGGKVGYFTPKFTLPTLSKLAWKYLDSLPEIQAKYDDSNWVIANIAASNNTVRPQTTPTSLYGSDYGFNTGNLLFRGNFIANGAETNLSIETWGGSAYAASVYLNGTLINAFPGNSNYGSWTQNMTLPKLSAKTSYILTILIDNMGLDEDWTVGTDQNKDPRGIVNYNLAGHAATDITWKITGNFGGENYADQVRGPLNEGGLYAERHGYHLPAPPSSSWVTASPFTGIKTPGVGFYSTNFELNLPAGYDIPLSFDFTFVAGANFRAQLYVNGYQFGKFVNNVGPQASFPVPEGILNYHGVNFVALSLWGFDAKGNALEGLELVARAEIMSGFGPVAMAPIDKWVERKGAY